MSSAKNWNITWLDHNAGRAYPLSNQATKLDKTGTFQLPDDLLVGLYLALPLTQSIRPAAFFLKTLRVISSSISLEIGYDDGFGESTVASTAVLKSQHAFGQAYPLRGIGDFFDAGGHVAVGSFANLDLQPAGTWEFSLAGGLLEPDAIRPQLRGVTSLEVSNGLAAGEVIVGDVIFRAGRNMRITPIIEVDADPVLVFDAIEGEGLNDVCVCADGTSASEPIRTINSIRPGPDGNLIIEGSECVELEPISGGLRIRNTCAEPCCGCKELKVVTDQLEVFGKQATTMENFLTRLEAEVSQMNLTVLGSRLNDRGCSDC